MAQIPQTINYQGLLEDNSGNPVADDNYTVVFTIYDAASAGNSLWTETRTVTTKDGFFSLTLGENSPINIATDAQLWLNINIGGTDLSPRTKLAGNLSSLSTKSVESTANAGNSVVDAINLSSGGIDASKIADGSIDNTELQYLNNLTSNVQSQLDDKQATLPDQSGNANKFLSTDGSNLSWQQPSGSGSSATVTTLSLASDIMISTTNYTDITGISQSLDANSTYLVKGILGAERQGGSSAITVKLDYTGTSNMNIMTIKTVDSDETGTIGSLTIAGSINKYIVNGVIDTDTAGTFQLKIKKVDSGNTNTKITTNTKLLLIKIR
jgi:hypothetical protein